MKKIAMFICLILTLFLAAGCNYADSNIEPSTKNESTNADTNKIDVEKESKLTTDTESESKNESTNADTNGNNTETESELTTGTESEPQKEATDADTNEMDVETESELSTDAESESKNESTNADTNEIDVEKESELTTDSEDETYVEDSQLSDLFLVKNTLESGSVISDDKAVDWGAEVLQASGIEITKTITILDETFELEYLESVKLPLNGYLVHTYAVKGQQYAKVLFSAETGRVVEYVNIPMKISYSTEAEYLEFIKSVVGESVDIEKFKYDKCTTWHYVFYDNGTESTVDDGFHVCGENERWVAYSFYFDKYLGEMKTLEHISAEFFEDAFSLEIYEFGYKQEMFEILTDKTPELFDNIGSFLSANISKDYTVSDFDVVGQVLFFREGKPYIKSVVEVSCASSDKDGAIVQRVEIIAGLSEEKVQ